MKARWQQGQRNWEEMVTVWLTKHRAVSLSWTDIYSALHKHFESFLVMGVKEKMNSVRKVCVYVLLVIRYYSMFAFTVWHYILDKIFSRWLCGCIQMVFTGFLFSLLSLHICCMARLTIWQLQKLIKAEAGKVIFTFHCQEYNFKKTAQGLPTAVLMLTHVYHGFYTSQICYYVNICPLTQSFRGWLQCHPFRYLVQSMFWTSGGRWQYFILVETLMSVLRFEFFLFRPAD